MGRGRVDDKNEEQVNGRLAWFDRDVLPVIEYFRENDRYTLLEINGEQTIEEVHREILEKLGW
jgi:adenylate kinase family enzyme